MSRRPRHTRSHRRRRWSSPSRCGRRRFGLPVRELVSSLPPHVLTQMKPHNIGIAGTGYMAARHADNLATHPAARLVRICSTERSAAAAEGFRTTYGFEDVATSFDRLLGDDIDVVFVCTPDALHA